MRIYGLKTNYQENPIGIELVGLTFSWKVDGAKGRFQKFARLLISEDAWFEKVVYDSGEANLYSCACTPDVKLVPARRYFWKVDVPPVCYIFLTL